MKILKRMNKVFTKNGDRINESTDWIQYFYRDIKSWLGNFNLENYSLNYWE